ncbi:MAG: biopolymer transporter ExbD [Myxococcota bacterium]
MRFAPTRAEGNGTPLAPLLDVVLLLLIFFVVTSSFATPTLELDLPPADATGSPEPDALVVELDEAGALAVDGVPTALDALASELVAARRDERPVELRADRRTAHGHVVAVLDRARSVGVVGLSIAVSNAKAGPEASAGSGEAEGGGRRDGADFTAGSGGD